MGPRIGPADILTASLVCAALILAPVPGAAEGRGLTANPSRPTTADNARFIEPHYLQVETGYTADLFEDPNPVLHRLNLLTIIGVSELFEARLGWDLYTASGVDSGLGDLTLGVKGGFFGGWDEATALAAIGELRLPSGDGPAAIGDGIEGLAALVATQVISAIQFDLQAGLRAHLFSDSPTFFIPISLAATWAPLDALRIYADIVEGLDLTNLSQSTTTIGGGAGYFILPNLCVDSAVRIGLSPSLPDISITGGVTVLAGPLW